MGLDILRANLRRTAAEPLLESPENSEPESETLAAEWLPLCPLIMTEGISTSIERVARLVSWRRIANANKVSVVGVPCQWWAVCARGELFQYVATPRIRL